MKDLERMMEAMSYVDHGLVEEAARPARRRSRLGRAVLIAACLCLVLTGTVWAVEKIFGVHLMDIFQGQPILRSGLSMSGYTAILDGVESFPQDSFSDEARELAADCSWEGTKVPQKSWDEAARFLGVGLPDSAVLEQARKTERYGVNDGTAHCYVHLQGDSRGLTEADVIATYAVEGIGDDGAEVDITIEATVYTELSDESVRSQVEYSYRGDKKIEPEYYTTTDGLETVLVQPPSVLGECNMWPILCSMEFTIR